MAGNKLKYFITADHTDFERGMNKVSSIAKTTGAAIGVGIATGAAAIAGLGVAMSGTIKSASDLQETQGKFDVVFKGLRTSAEGWSKTLVESYAMSTTESKKYLSSIQDLLVPTGMARKEAGELSNNFVKLAADLGSFNNMETADVIRDIQSALQGGSETMAKYGINVKVSQVEQEVFRLGLAKTKGEITDAHKAQALYSIMMRQSADAVGDMARTSDSYANQTKQLTANVSNLSAEIGTALLQAVTEVVKDVNSWWRANDKVITQDITTFVDAVAGAVSGLGSGLKVVVGWMEALDRVDNKATISALKSEMAGLNKQLDLAAIGFGSMSSKEVEHMKNQVSSLKDLIADLEKGKPFAPVAAGAKDVSVVVNESAEDIRKADEKTAVSVVDNVAKVSDAQLKAIAKKTKAESEATAKRIRETEMQIYAMNGIEQAQGIAQDSWLRNIELTKEYDQTVEDVDVALKEFFDDMPLAAKKSTDAMTRSWHGFTHDAERNFSDVLAGGMKGEITSIGDAWDNLTSSMLNSFIDMVADMGAHQISSALFGESDRSGASVSSGLLSGVISGAGNYLSGAGSSIVDSAGGFLSDAGSAIWDGAKSIFGFASGGYHSGGWRVVGEQGPELAFTGPETILNNSDSTALMSTLAQSFVVASQSAQLMNWTIRESSGQSGDAAESVDGLSDAMSGLSEASEDSRSASEKSADAAALAAGSEFDLSNAAVDMAINAATAATGLGLVGKGLVSVVDHFTGFISSIKASVNQLQSESFGSDASGVGGYGPNNSFSAPDRDKFGLDAWGGSYGDSGYGTGESPDSSSSGHGIGGFSGADLGKGGESWGGGDTGGGGNDGGGMGVGDSGGDPGDAGSAGEGPGLAGGGIVRKLLVPRGDDGFAALSLGEGVVNKKGMEVLDQINRGSVSSQGQVTNLTIPIKIGSEILTTLMIKIADKVCTVRQEQGVIGRAYA